MSYIPNQQQLKKLIKDLGKVEFFEWATRPLGFHFWEIDLSGYDEYYKKFIGRKFKYVVLLSKGDYEIQYRNKKQHQEFIDFLYSKLKNFSFLQKHERILHNIYKGLARLASKLQ